MSMTFFPSISHIPHKDLNLSWLTLQPVFCAMWSIAINPALCRVVSYFGSGLPSPTTRNSGVPVTVGAVLRLFNFSKISYIIHLSFLARTHFLQGRQQGRTTTDPHPVMERLWSACPFLCFSVFQTAHFAAASCFFSRCKISALHQVPFGCLFLQSQWVIAPVI